MSKQKIWELIEAYRTSGGSEEHHARKELLDAALDKALAQPEQEPVAQKIWEEGAYGPEITELRDIPVGAFLYTTPPQRTWVGLTDEEMTECIVSICNTDDGTGNTRDLIRAVEAKLKEKNT